MCRTNNTDRFREKMSKNHVNPLIEVFLQLMVLFGSPLMWAFSLVHDKIMMKFLNRTYIYNVSWEDPRMDHRVFNLQKDDHIITIASAGCNALDYVIEGAKVTAVDFNLCQIALTEIKAIAIQELEWKEFFAIFAENDMVLLQRRYHEKLRQHMSPKSVEFWDKGIYTVGSFQYSGTSGQMAYVLFRWMFWLLGLGWMRTMIMKGCSPDEFQAEMNRHQLKVRTLAWMMDNLFIRGGSLFAGVPERQLNLGIHRPNNLARVMDRVFFQTDMVNDNYFYLGYLLGHYTKENCPRYLKEEHYPALRKHLSEGKLQLFHGSINQALNKTTEPITVASLLDHMDWMTERMINEEITLLLRKMDHSRGRIYWRSFADFEDGIHAAPLFWLKGVPVDDHDDRVGMYFSTWIAHLKDCPYAYEDRVDVPIRSGLVSQLWTGFKIVTYPFAKYFIRSSIEVEGHGKDMEAFYRFQKDGYDEFREGLLHAKPTLMESIALKKAGKMVWVDVGGGTARNLEYLAPEVIRKYFSRIIILDVSKSLLEVAQARIKKMGLEDIATVLEHDFTAESVFAHLPTEGTVDLVTMSYSLSMIPNKKKALSHSSRLVKKGEEGCIAIADFFSSGNHDDCLPPIAAKMRTAEAAFHRAWFAQDHVHLLQDELFDAASKEASLDKFWDKRFRGAVPFIPLLKPFHGVVMLHREE